MTVYELCDLILNIETNVQIFKYSEGENVFHGTADNAMNAFYANDIVTAIEVCDGSLIINID